MNTQSDYDFSSRKVKNVLILGVSGRIHCANVTRFQDECEARCRDYAGPAVLDLTEAVYICTSCWAFFLTLKGQFHDKDSELVMVVKEGLVKKILTVLGFHTKFAVYDSIQQAVDSFS